jgi:hypothetical protein
MRLPRVQFTIRQLIKLVALAAVFFALIRTPSGLLVVAIGGLIGLWMGAVSITICVIVFIIKRLEILLRDKPMTDASCGPIVWRGFNDLSPRRATGGLEPWRSPSPHSNFHRQSG